MQRSPFGPAQRLSTQRQRVSGRCKSILVFPAFKISPAILIFFFVVFHSLTMVPEFSKFSLCHRGSFPDTDLQSKLVVKNFTAAWD